jgi:hypothetical protein
MRKIAVTIAALGATLVLAASAGAYGGGSSHDTWQVGLSFNCDNPSFCGNDLGGFWGWVEFDRWSDGSITGDAQLTGCGHSVGGGGPGSAGAGHIDLDITKAVIGPSKPDDPNYPSGHVFYVRHNVAHFLPNGGTVTDDKDFLGDSGIPVEPGHYSFHPAPGVAFTVNVSYRAAS